MNPPARSDLRSVPRLVFAHALCLAGHYQECIDVLLDDVELDAAAADNLSVGRRLSLLLHAAVALGDGESAAMWAKRLAHMGGPAGIGFTSPGPLVERGAAHAGPSVRNVLSARERNVAVLVADGKTNRQIAAALYLSEKTVERHLSRIFTKLDISTRASLASLITRQAILSVT